MALPGWITDDPARIRPDCSLPIAYEGPRQYSGLGIALFGLLFGGAPILGAMVVGLKRGTSPWMLAPFALFGLGLAWFGVEMYFWRPGFVITGESVSRTLETLRGSKRWEEPLSAYKGIAYRRTLQSVSIGGQLYWHELVLRHATRSDRDLSFFRQRNHDDSHERLRDFAALLHLSTLPDEDYDAGRPRS